MVDMDLVYESVRILGTPLAKLKLQRPFFYLGGVQEGCQGGCLRLLE